MYRDGAVSAEIAAIRRELIALQNSVSAYSPDAPIPSRLSASGGGAALTKEEAEALDVLEGQLSSERARRAQLEAALQSGFSGEKDAMLERLTRERDELRRWLRRGVAECRRVAEEAARLRQALHERRSRVAALTETRDTRRAELHAAAAELRAAQEALRAVRWKSEEGPLLEREGPDPKGEGGGEGGPDSGSGLGSGLGSGSGSGLGSGSGSSLLGRLEALRAEAEALRCAAPLDESLHCAQQSAERVGQLIGHMRRLRRAVSDGRVGLDDEEQKDGKVTSALFLRGEEAASVAEAPQSLDEIIARGRALLRELPAAVEELRGGVAALFAAECAKASEQSEAHRTHMEAAQTQKLSKLRSYDTERVALMREITETKARAAALIVGRVEQEMNEDAAAALIDEMGFLLAENDRIAQRNAELREANSSVRAKMRRLRVDWAKVHESQGRFQQLQIEVEMIARANERVQRENETLSLLIETKNDTCEETELIAAEPSEVRGALRMSHRTTATRGSPESEAFQEWKRAAIAEYTD